MQLRHEAARTLTMLSDAPGDVFNVIFLTKVDDPILRYDFAARYSFPDSCLTSELPPLSQMALI